MSTRDGLVQRMRAASRDELVRICTVEAGDYTHEAIELARRELVSRGEDVSGLVASTAETTPSDPRRLAGTLIIGSLGVALLAAPWLDSLPTWAAIAIEAAATSLALVGAVRYFGAESRPGP